MNFPFQLDDFLVPCFQGCILYFWVMVGGAGWMGKMGGGTTHLGEKNKKLPVKWSENPLPRSRTEKPPVF